LDFVSVRSGLFISVNLHYRDKKVVGINIAFSLLLQKAKHYIVTHPGRPGHSLKIKNVADCLQNSPLNELLKVCYPKQRQRD
jgi:hypothetical protein